MKTKLTTLLILGFLPFYSQAEDCPCDIGIEGYLVDCDGDGVNESCTTGDCGPCFADNPPSSGMKCCGNVEYDSTPDWAFRPYNINLQKLNEAFGAVSNVFYRFGPCSQTAGGAPIITTELAVASKCCNENLVSKDKYKGSVMINMGTVSCNWPISGIPRWASGISINIAGSLAGRFTMSLSGEQTCTEPRVCATGTFSITAGGGGSVTTVGNVISARVELQVSLSAEGSWCSDTGTSSKAGLKKIALVGTATLAGDYFSTAVNHTLWEDA
jgi:hypothetical protein